MQRSTWEMEVRGGCCPHRAEGQCAWLLWGNTPINKSLRPQDKETDVV